MNDTLALFGGRPIIPGPMSPFNTLGEEEVDIAASVIRSGVLSGYIGAAGPGFMGGERVKSFERDVTKYFGVKHAIAVNSWTSGLVAAIGAIGIEPGDEVITTPWTMAATATAILHWNGIPVFADIDPESFNISPFSVERLITKRTRAILAVDIFGQSADMVRLREIADRHNLMLLSDTAQAPGALTTGHFTGTLADIGGFSLNYHKHIHCGEGGILVTNNDQLAERLRLIRNHGEAVIISDQPKDLCNILGHNFRMGEIEAGIAAVQLKKLSSRISSRNRIARELDASLNKLSGLRTPRISDGCTHVYYVYGMVLDTKSLGVTRDRIFQALSAEGVPGLMCGYANLHLLPLFQKKIAYGTKGFPWNSSYCESEVTYGVGTCPVAEELHKSTFLGLNICLNELPTDDVEKIVKSFQKVWSNLNLLRS